MKRCLLLIMILCLGLVSLGAKVKPFNYAAQWKEADKLMVKGLYQSYAEMADSIYQQAVRDGKTDQQIKALIGRLTALMWRKDNYYLESIAQTRECLKTAAFPSSAILHSLLASLYWDYYTDNRWKFANRGATSDLREDDIATWDLRKIAEAAISEFRLSLERSAELQLLAVADYPAMLEAGGAEERKLRPTLYDFLANRALDFYLNDESGISLPQVEFALSDPQYFGPASEFSRLAVVTPDSLSLKYQATALYQDLIRFHSPDRDPSALLEIELARLSFVHANSTLANADSLYADALRRIQTDHARHPASALAAFNLAKLLRDQGRNYDPQVSEEYRWHYQRAVEICKTAAQAHPNSFGEKSCKKLAASLTQPHLELLAEKYVAPQTPVKARLSAKNISGAEVRIYSVPALTYKTDLTEEESNWSKRNYKKVRALLKKKPLWSGVFPLENEGDLRAHSYELALASLPKGRYLIVAANLEEGALKGRKLLGYCLINCTGIAYAVPQSGSGDLLLADRVTGQPLAGAEVKIYSEDWDRFLAGPLYNLRWSGTSDFNGVVSIPYDSGYLADRATIAYGGDLLTLLYYNAYSFPDYKSLDQQCLLFTDRSIYRPGQTIYVKGVLFDGDGVKRNYLLPNQGVTVEFWDASSKIVERKYLFTNDYATFNCSFQAPLSSLNGGMSIRVGTSIAYFNVEEYKRPRFEVTVDQPSATYKLNQNVTVTGKGLTYSGVPVDNAPLTYRVTRQARYPIWFWWWGPLPQSYPKAIAHGSARTDANGEFAITFFAAGDASALQDYDPYFAYEISVDLTDLGGETRSGSLTLRIGERDLILDPLLPEQIDRQQQTLTIPIQTTNLGGESVPARGTVTISRLQTPDHIQKSRLWDAPDRNYLSSDEFLRMFPHDSYGTDDDITGWKVTTAVWSGSFATPDLDSLEIGGLDGWEPGAYVVQAVAGEGQQSVMTTRYFTLFDSQTKQLPYPLADWFVPLKTVCEPGETARVLIGSAYDACDVLLEVEKDERIVETRRVSLDQEQKVFSFEVTEQDRGGFFVHFTWFRDGRFYTHSQEISVPWTNKQLKFEYLTFRDKLLPGAQEEWRLKIKDSSGGKVTAELLASMYDASLDMFRSNTWKADVFGGAETNGGWENESQSVTSLKFINQPGYVGSYPYRQYDAFCGHFYDSSLYRLNSSIFSLQSGVTTIGGTLHIRGGRANEVNYTVDGMSISDPLDGGYVAEYGEAQSGVINIVTKYQSAVDSGKSKPPREDLSGIQARVNFNETAFFYPELRTDENGDVSVAFTVPEALTRWKFRALALTRDFRIGTTERTALTQKPFMVQPNAPRFLREGDRITLTAKVSSLDGSSLSGTCQLYLLDAQTLQPVDGDFGLTQPQRAFMVGKGASAALSWDLRVPEGLGAVLYRVVARAGSYSDGEENVLPILSNRMLVTESLPLNARGHETNSFVFNKLRDSGDSSTLSHHKLSLEYTSNPAWYAILSLPYLMEFPYDCNEQIFSRYYANSIASHLANSNPRIKEVFAAWRNAPDSPASNLEKNPELKSLLLEETPWVLDAEDETLNQRRVGLLFADDNLAGQMQAALNILDDNQSYDGGWPWFPGMPDSWWVTQHIVEGFGHLDKLGVTAVRKDWRLWSMLRQAVAYLDGQILEDYQDIKKDGDLKDDNLGYLEMHYLYARSFFSDLPLSGDLNTAVKYFQGQAEKYWLDQNPYGQGLIALTLHRAGKDEIPAQIVASLKERAQQDEELGMWWDTGNQGWFWYQAPIETQALLIETFAELGEEDASVEAMRTWLLKQKQTTSWRTTKATTEACYALLLGGPDWLDTEQLAEIRLGGSVIAPAGTGARAEAGTGYFKTSWSGDAIQPRMAEVTVANPNAVPSWGALYWQYFEDLDRITSADTSLQLSKQLFVQRDTERGKVLIPLGENAQLQVGDKVVVRIELRSDRDLEYVHLKDMRGAGFEPLNVLSGYKWQDGLGYYEETGDAATNFFIDYLRKGTYVFEYPLRVSNTGEFSNGVATIQCMYAPEFSAHSEGIRVQVK